MKNKEIVLQEFFTTPLNLVEVDRVHNEPVFSSDKLIAKFKESLKNSYLTEYSDTFNKLIDKRIITPIYVTKGLFGFIIRKAFANSFEQGTMGYYATENNRIYILVENNSKMLFWTTDDDSFAELTIHELMHYIAHNNSKLFYTTFNKMYQTYFSTFLSDVYGTKIDNKHNINELIVFIHNNIEMKRKIDKNILVKYGKLLDKITKKEVPDDDKREYHTMMILKTIKLYITDPMAYMYHIRYSTDIKNIFWAMIDAYKELGIDSPKTLAIQELIFPSEVICIASAKRDLSPEFKKILKVLI